MRRAWLVVCLWLLAFAANAADLKIATWNLEWLTERPAGDPALPTDARPKRAEDIAMLRRYAEQLDADVIAVQEVDGPEVARKIFAPEKYVLHFTADRVVQRTGFAIRRTIAVRANPDFVGLVIDPAAPHPLRSGADITIRSGSATLRLLAVHLKTGCRQDPLSRSTRPQCEVLRAQLASLQGWVAERARELVPFVILGDFNRWMDKRDQFLTGLQRAAPLVRATEEKSNPCWGGGNFIDHILAGGAARGWLDRDSLRLLIYRETGQEWRRRLSDHCPVSVRLRLPE